MADLDRRVAIATEHMRLENAHDFAGCIGEFGRPRYEVLADDAALDGAEGVEDFLMENRRAFPDFRFEPTRVAPADEIVLVEGVFKGPRTAAGGGYRPPEAGPSSRCASSSSSEGEAMVTERIHFDLGTPLRQLGVAYDPDTPKGKVFTLLNHPITIVRAGLRTARLWITGRKR